MASESFNGCQHILQQMQMMTTKKYEAIEILRKNMYLDHIVKMQKFEIEQLEADLDRQSKLASKVCAPPQLSLFKY